MTQDRAERLRSLNAKAKSVHALRSLALRVSERATAAELRGGRPYHLPVTEEEEALIRSLGLAHDVLQDDPEAGTVAVVEVLLSRAGL